VVFSRRLEFIYFAMFLQIGATLIFLRPYYADEGKRCSIVGTILFSYYIALLMFLSLARARALLSVPRSLLALSRQPADPTPFQKTLIAHALALWRH